jgi:hypothetical protein
MRKRKILGKFWGFWGEKPKILGHFREPRGKFFGEPATPLPRFRVWFEPFFNAPRILRGDGDGEKLRKVNKFIPIKHFLKIFFSTFCLIPPFSFS